jgi:hypothetical protein
MDLRKTDNGDWTWIRPVLKCVQRWASVLTLLILRIMLPQSFFTVTQLHGAKSFLTSRQPRNSPSFQNTEDTLPYSQESATKFYAEPVESNPQPYALFKIHLDIVLQSISRSTKGSLPFNNCHCYYNIFVWMAIFRFRPSELPGTDVVEDSMCGDVTVKVKLPTAFPEFEPKL